MGAKGHETCATSASPHPPGTVIAHFVYRDVTVIGGSAGTITALKTLLAQLPADYPAAVLIVVHIAPESPSILHQLFRRVCALPVVAAAAEMPIRRGQVVVAPPDQHLICSGDRLLLSHRPRENRHRPSIDVLFRSAAVAHGARVTGVILSGMLDDGAAGLWAIARRGGACVVQDPADADFPDLPSNALEQVPSSRLLSLRQLPSALVQLASEPITLPADGVSPHLASEVHMATGTPSSIDDLDALGRRSPYSCPECGGALWEVSNPGERFRCHVGHAYSMKTLVCDQAERIEAALWAALRGLEENERLSRRLADDAAQRLRAIGRFPWRARAHASHAGVLRRLIAEAVTLPAQKAAAE